MIGIVPAAGAGERIQPLGCSKELLPVGSRIIDGVERPKAVSEYLVERMIAAGATRICIVISARRATSSVTTLSAAMRLTSSM